MPLFSLQGSLLRLERRFRVVRREVGVLFRLLQDYFHLVDPEIPGLRFGQELAEARSYYFQGQDRGLFVKLSLQKCAHRALPCQLGVVSEQAAFLCEPAALRRNFNQFESSFLLVGQCCNLIGRLNYKS